MSSGSESDEDYVPKEPEQVSEEDSADDETEQQYENESQQISKKRKAVKQKRGKRKKAEKGDIDIMEEEKKTELIEEIKDPEDEKKREDDLWAMFLEGTDTKPRSEQKTANTPKQPLKSGVDCKKDVLATKITKKDVTNDAERERRIFEFAGETIVVENNIIKEKIKAAENPLSISESLPSQSRSSGGISNILGQLNKKNKLSTLEKSKLDWDTYKKEEDINDEIQSHNKGKLGYLERQDFLARADIRQYEIERDLRMKKRSK